MNTRAQHFLAEWKIAWSVLAIVIMCVSISVYFSRNDVTQDFNAEQAGTSSQGPVASKATDLGPSFSFLCSAATVLSAAAFVVPFGITCITLLRRNPLGTWLRWGSARQSSTRGGNAASPQLSPQWAGNRAETRTTLGTSAFRRRTESRSRLHGLFGNRQKTPYLLPTDANNLLPGRRLSVPPTEVPSR